MPNNELTHFFTPEEVINFSSKIVRVMDNGYVNNPCRDCYDCDKCDVTSANQYNPRPELINFMRALGESGGSTENALNNEIIAKSGDNYTATAGCYPKGISEGCSKYLECKKKNDCPLEGISLDSNEDIFPKLRRCEYMGCVRPERAKKWLTKVGIKIAERDIEIKIKKLEENKKKGDPKLDELCPHHWRVWQTDAGNSNPRKNPFRTLQCEISRPSSCLVRLSDLSVLSRHNSFDIPQGWYHRLGFSGVGIIVVARQAESLSLGSSSDSKSFYLQLSSKQKELRDYYEFPYFSMGRTNNVNNVRWDNNSGFPLGILLQLLFRCQREQQGHKTKEEKKTGEPLPEIVYIFDRYRSEKLSDWEEFNKVMYCPAGEIAAWLFMWSLLSVEVTSEDFVLDKLHSNLLEELIKGELNVNDNNGELERIKTELADLLKIDKPRNSLTCFRHVGLVDDNDQKTIRASAMIEWVKEIEREKQRVSEGLGQDFRFCAASLGNGSKYEDSNQQCEKPIAKLIQAYQNLKGKEEVTLKDLADEYVRSFSSDQKKMKECLDQLLLQSRFPLLPYLAWWRMSDVNYLLGHFVVPLGSGDRFGGNTDYSEKDNRFFLAGIDEILWMEHKQRQVDYGKDRYFSAEKKLHDIIPITSRLVSPISDATISYTFFQCEVKEEKNRAKINSQFKTHQMNTTMLVIRSDLEAMKNEYHNNGYIDDPCLFDKQMKRFDVLTEENEVFLCYTTDLITENISAKINRMKIPEIITEIRNSLEKCESLAKKDREIKLDFSDKLKNVISNSKDYYYPGPFLNSALREITNNYGKYGVGPVSVGFKIDLRDDDVVLKVIFRGARIKHCSSAGKGFGVGVKAIESIINFISDDNFSIEKNFDIDKDKENFYKCMLPLNVKKINSRINRLKNDLISK